MMVSGTKRAQSKIADLEEMKERDERKKKKKRIDSKITSLITAVRTVTAFPRVSYYLRSMSPLSSVTTRVASSPSSCASYMRTVTDPFFFFPTRVFSFISISTMNNSRGKVVEISWKRVLLIYDHGRTLSRPPWFFAVYTCARPSVYRNTDIARAGACRKRAR